MTPRPTSALRSISPPLLPYEDRAHSPPPQDGVQERDTDDNVQRDVDEDQDEVAPVDDVLQVRGYKGVQAAEEAVRVGSSVVL